MLWTCLLMYISINQSINQWSGVRVHHATKALGHNVVVHAVMDSCTDILLILELLPLSCLVLELIPMPPLLLCRYS